MKNVILLFAIIMVSCQKEKVVCPPGYTGDTCTEEVQPKSVRMRYVRLFNYPTSNNGSSWDNFSPHADPFFVVQELSGSQLYQSNVTIDLPPQTAEIWDVDVKLDPEKAYYIEFRDLDENGEYQYITSTAIIPYFKGEGFPRDLYLDNIQIGLSYEH